MKDRKRFAHRIDMWDDDGENIVEHLAGVEDFDLAMATYRAACLRWPRTAIARSATALSRATRRLVAPAAAGADAPACSPSRDRLPGRRGT